jgi:adenosine deaminase
VETKELLSCEPERLGHATFLDEEARKVVLERGTCIEICLTSNLLCAFPFLRLFRTDPTEERPSRSPGRCNTVLQLQDHHIRYYLARNHPIAISVRPFVFTYTLFPFLFHLRSVRAHLRAPS